MPRTRRILFAAVTALVAAGASANDKDLLYQSKAAPPNVMVVMSNTTTMANLPGTSQIDVFGQADGRSSKMGIAKNVLNNVIKNNPDINWGLSSFSYTTANFLPQGNATGSKHYVFEPATDNFPGLAYNRPAGTRVLFGKGAGAAGQTFSANGVTYGVLQWQPPASATIVAPTGGGQSNVTITYDPASAPTSAGDTTHLPFGGSTGTRKVLLINVAVPGRDATAEMLVEITSANPYRINRDLGESFTVQETLYKCKGGNAPCDPADSTKSSVADGPRTTQYVVPSEYCTESDVNCDYPQVFGYGADAGREIGWTTIPTNSVPSAVQDWTHSSGNASGWMQQSNTNPQPIVMIPRDYTPFTPYPQASPSHAQQTYAQKSIPCMVQAMRPSAATVHLDTTGYANRDDFPTFVPGQSSPTQNTACDRMIDGYYQTRSSLDTSNNASQTLTMPIFPTINGNVAPLTNMLTNVFQYYNGGNSPGSCNSLVDTFCAGKRPDDPFANCRHDYVILVTDSFAAQSAVTNKSTDPPAQLKAIGIKVYVIGFGVNQGGGDAGQTDVCKLPDNSNGNNGQCIAYWTGAQTYNSDGTVKDPGYFTASNATQLLQAINAVLNQLDRSNRDFATATIPSVSATSEGVAYFSEFNPRNNRSVWSGHLRAFALDPATGDVQTTGAPDFKPLATVYTFGTGTTPPAGSFIWDAGNTDTEGDFANTHVGNLDSTSSGGRIDPTRILSAGTTWSESTHDQATGVVGRNVLFSLKAGDSGCTSTSYECLVQVPVGDSGGSAPSSPPNSLAPPPVPPGSLPTWWSTAMGYANVPASGYPESSRDQALQNTFSFLRGNRDVVVESLKIAQNKFFDANHQTCYSLASDPDSPCYKGEILGDIFHSNPTVVSFPNEPAYFLTQDPNTAVPGLYADRGNSYQTFFMNHAHRRKILYAGADDGLFHAFDVGVYNGDTSSYTDPVTGSSVSPLSGKYDLGSGREIFAFAPRSGLAKSYKLAHTVDHDWTIDGAPSVGDVYIDVARVGGTPQGVKASGAGADLSGTSPTWRTILIATEREGGLPAWPDPILANTDGQGGSVFALDITDPDKAAHMALSDAGGHVGAPECLATHFDPGADSPVSGCDAPFPRVLWQLRDDHAVSATTAVPAEKSGSVEAATQDLGMTWSQPVIGRIKVHDSLSDSNRDFFVAIFGGGYSHSGASQVLADVEPGGNTGNFLYMADVETGKIIYKRNLGLWDAGASGTNTTGNLAAGVPGQPAAVDTDLNGYLDRIYIGDTQGRIWRVDMSSVARFCTSVVTGCTAANARISSSDWNPTLFFDEYQTAAPPSGRARQPIFNRPSVFGIGTTATGAPKVAIAFGTGDRDNMPVSTDTWPNYFVVAVDNGTAPLYLSSLTSASLTSNACSAAGTCLAGNGYYVALGTASGGAQIVNTNTLVIGGTIIFNTFLHTTVPGNCNEVGVAYPYRVDTKTGVSLYTDANGNPTEHGTSNAEVISSPVAYFDVTGHAIGVGDRGGAFKEGTGTPPTVVIKSWKEQ